MTFGTCLFAALLQLLYTHLQADAPVRQLPAGPLPQVVVEQRLNEFGSQVSSASGGGNLSMHFEGFDPAEFQQDLLMSMFYFRAAYVLYPHRVIVGTGDRVINSAVDLAAADVLPDEEWLRRHDVRATLYIRRMPDGAIDQQVRPRR